MTKRTAAAPVSTQVAVWVDGKLSGKGTVWYANGDQYQGELRGGKMHGRGKYRYAGGDWYEGDWIDINQRHGDFNVAVEDQYGASTFTADAVTAAEDAKAAAAAAAEVAKKTWDMEATLSMFVAG